eukprot:jgi/Mesen1/2073/ME000151S01334
MAANNELENEGAQICEASNAQSESPEPLPDENREEVLARHRKETKELQSKEVAMKKATAKGSKAEQKAKKKAVEEEVARLDAKMKARHTKELASLGFSEEKLADAPEMDIVMETLVKAVAGVGMGPAKGLEAKPTKAQKRRDKKLQEEVDRDHRIQEEQKLIVSDRKVEGQRLEAKLQPLGFTLKDIKPDGHCMYRAVEDQLRLRDGETAQQDHTALRALAAGYMRDHVDDFLPFVVADENEKEGKTSGSVDPINRFEQYCLEVETTALWGGQLELGALAQALRKQIIVYSADLPEVEMGSEYSRSDFSGPLRVSYHRHAFGLGEHYNSVIPMNQHDGPVNI